MNKGTQQRFFRRSLFQMFALLLMPMLLFSSVSIFLAASNATREANESSESTLLQMREKLELILNELDGIVLSFDTESEISVQLRAIIRNEMPSIERAIALRMIRSHVSSSAYTRPYVDSVYIYLDNQNDWMLHSMSGLEKISRMVDKAWYSSYMENRDYKAMWTERRPLLQYEFQRTNPQYTVSLYRVIRNGQGIIVMNTSPRYLEQQLQKMCSYQNQMLLVLSDQDELMLKSTSADPVLMENVMKSNALQAAGEGKRITTAGARVATAYSQKFGWKFVSVIPETSLYALANRLTAVSLAVLIAEAFFSIFIAYIYSRSNYRKLQKIYETFDAARSNRPLPPLPAKVGDEYGYITQNLITTFIQQNYLTVQLEHKHYRMKNMELLALQSQINPHFLVNTLRTMFWKSMALTKGRMNDVGEMIENLTALLDFSLGNPQETVTLREELSATRSYIEIQKIRYQGRFEVEYDVEEQVEDAHVLKLLLQPLVENSIHHGFAGGRKGRIVIRAAAQGEQLSLSVQDDGTGMSAEKLCALRVALAKEGDFSEHIGLYNTNKRIELFYDLSMGLSITSADGQGTVVKITLPLLKTEQELNPQNI